MAEPMQTAPAPGAETYLGDGLYASFDGYSVRLRAPRGDADHWVALEPATWRALRGWLAEYPVLKQHMERGG